MMAVATNGKSRIDPSKMGGSSGHHDPRTSKRLQVLMAKMPLFLELDRLDAALNGPDGWEKVSTLIGNASNSMLLTTKQLAEANPPTYKSIEKTLVKLTPDERKAAAAEEAEMPESEFYGLKVRSERAPGHMW